LTWRSYETPVPLTEEQRNWLRVNTILPALFAAPIVAIVGSALVFIHRRFGAAWPVTIFVGLAALLLIAVTSAVALHVMNNLRDARRGVADVAVARLTGKRGAGWSPKTLYAEFESVGSVIVMGDVYEGLVAERWYRVTFSPYTRRCWAVVEV